MDLVPFDAAKHLDAVEDQIDLISDALAIGDPGYIATAIGVVALGVCGVRTSVTASESGMLSGVMW